MCKLFKSLFLISSVTLSLMSCVSIPTKTQLVSSVQAEKNSSSECEIENLKSALGSKLEPEQQLDQHNISVMNWNIYKAQRDNWSEDFQKFIKYTDLLILQEATASPEVKHLLNRQHANWRLNNAFLYAGYETGVLTASSIKPVFSCGLRTTEPFIRVPKTVLINLYPLAGTDKKLLVANLHAINFTLGTAVYTDQLQNMISMVKQHTGPLIIAGDFNTWSESRMSIVNDMASLLSLKAVVYNAHNRKRVFGYPLDHVYYRGLEVNSEHVMPVTSSDHNPIKVNFRLPI